MSELQTVGVHKIPCSGPGDLSAVRRMLESGELVAGEIVAVMGKTEGNGCVNDFTRDFAAQAWCELLAPRLNTSAAAVHRTVALVMSGGTEGVLSPHFTVFTRGKSRATTAGTPRLAIGVAFTRDFLPEEMGRLAQVTETADAVRAAMRDGGIERIEDVHFVQIKCPLLTAAKVGAALARGVAPVTRDTYESMGLSRGASALGAAAALGEIDASKLSDAGICSDWALYSATASTSAGIELENNVVIVMGMSRASTSPYIIAHGVMNDAIDAASVRACLSQGLGLDPDRDAAAVRERVLNIFAKAEASPDGMVRGARHTMLNDSDINSTRHARAAVGAVIASVIGRTDIYVSGGAEHQGPPGGGPFAIIART
jgi:cyanuric acid amidohydrolase